MKNTIVDILKMDTPKDLEVFGWIKSFRGNLKYVVFKINEHILKKYFK